jgi:hypothetical protein
MATGDWTRKVGQNKAGGKCYYMDDHDFNFIDVLITSIGKNGQIYCSHTRSGLHYVYAHFEKDTNKLFYIGLGKNNRCNQVHQRNTYWKNVFKKHGIVIKFIATDLSISDAKNIEKEWILKTNPICNMTMGGEAGESTVRTKVYCYGKNGSFYKTFNSLSDANIYFLKGEKDSRIGRCLSGKRLSAHGFIWKKEYTENIPKYVKPKAHNAKTVYRYNLDGFFIEKLNSSDSFKEGVKSGISQCLDRNYTYKGSFWRNYKVDKIECVVPKPALKEPKKVINSLTGKIYMSISSAAKELGRSGSYLEDRLNGKIANNTTFNFYS